VGAHGESVEAIPIVGVSYARDGLLRVASWRSHGRPEKGRSAADRVGGHASRDLRRRLGLLVVVSGRRGVDVGAVRDRAGVVTVRAEHVPQAEDAFSTGVRKMHAETYPDRATTPTVMGWRKGWSARSIHCRKRETDRGVVHVLGGDGEVRREAEDDDHEALHASP
jgi:hypothetical protein